MGGTMEGCGRCMKLGLITLNVCTFIGGVLALALGIWVLATRSFPSQLLANNMFLASTCTVVAAGAGIALVSVLGCLAAAKEVKCMLLTYFILMFIIFVTTLVSGILLMVFREKIEGTMERELRAAMPLYGNRDEFTGAWDQTQSLLQCCGVRSYRDWNEVIPESCCREVYPGKRQDCRRSPNPSTLYIDGCLHKSVKFLRSAAAILGGVAIFVALLSILGLVFSCGLFIKIE